MLRIRLSRKGNRNRPFYAVVLADARAPRSSFKEKLGFYDPLKKKDDAQRLVVNMVRLQECIKCGAIPTDPIKRLLKLDDRSSKHSNQLNQN